MAKEKVQTEIDKRANFEVATEVPDFLKDLHGNEGMEHVQASDTKMARIVIAQKMSPEMDEDKPEYIEGLKFGHLFNNVTKLIIGEGPIFVTPIKLFQTRIKFREGGGVDCMSRNGIDGGDITPEGCVHCAYSRFSNGEPPECDELKNFLVYVHNVPSDDPLEHVAVISLKSKGLKTSKTWLGLMAGRNKPIYTGVYKLSVYKDKGSKGESYQFKADNAGYVSDPQLVAWLKEQFDGFKERDIDTANNGITKNEEVPF